MAPWHIPPTPQLIHSTVYIVVFQGVKMLFNSIQTMLPLANSLQVGKNDIEHFLSFSGVIILMFLLTGVWEVFNFLFKL